MDDLSLLAMNPFVRFFYSLWLKIAAIPSKLWRAIKSIPHKFKRLGLRIGNGFKSFGLRFWHGGVKTKLSYFICGSGAFLQGQIVKGLLMLATQVGYILLLALPVLGKHTGLFYLGHLGSLGTVESQVIENEYGFFETIPGDHSTLILLYALMFLVIGLGVLMVYVANTKVAFNNEQLIKEGGKPRGFKGDVRELLDKKFYVTLMTLPSLGTITLTILPLIFMILLAFTNFDKNHLPPNLLFDWVGLDNFKALFSKGMSAKTFWPVLGWTVVWAFFATFTNYFLGIIVALMINKKGIRLKKLWRTCLVITAAVPQFVSLLVMRLLLHEAGAINVVLRNWGLIETSLPFLTKVLWARVSVIVVNIWVGVPFTMLITTGILMNIPADLYESAKIDGANVFKMFFKITMPYVMFVTAPYLITQFIGNLNNFNVIYLLTGGAPSDINYYMAGKTDLLVTWLYKLTLNEKDFKMASTIGIMVFLLSAVFALLTYSNTSSYKKEEEFS